MEAWVLWSYMSTLGYSDGTAQAALDLSHVHHTRHPNHLQHAIVVGGLGKLVLPLWTPWVGTRRPAGTAHKTNVSLGSPN